MLARRVVARPATLSSQLQRRFILPSSRSIPRPNTWLAKIRFRADGKPRSKLIALGSGSLILLNLFLLYTLYNTIEEEDTLQDYLEKVICMQHTDIISYDSVDFDDFESTLSYFKKLYQHFSGKYEEEVDDLFTHLLRTYKQKADQGSKTPFEVLTQRIMKSTAEKIHIAFRGLNSDRESLAKTVIFMSRVMNKAMLDLWVLLVDEDNSC